MKEAPIGWTPIIPDPNNWVNVKDEERDKRIAELEKRVKMLISVVDGLNDDFISHLQNHAIGPHRK